MSLRKTLLSSTVIPLAVSVGLGLAVAGCATDENAGAQKKIGYMCSPTMICGPNEHWGKQAACNPCNPCAAANPCNPCNPCAVAVSCNPCNPCSPCNPCAAN